LVAFSKINKGGTEKLRDWKEKINIIVIFYTYYIKTSYFFKHIYTPDHQKAKMISLWIRGNLFMSEMKSSI